jgi:DNA-nicking Smr family endonuclease
VSQLYMSYRQRALQLGAARNACLSRAADAWRRGDGAAAKRFSREGHDLNAKMSAEAADAAGKLVRERAKLTEQAVRGRDMSWSDDSSDRTNRGKMMGAGLGVCLGIASKDTEEGMAKLTSEERMEVALDLHGLHSNEATEVLEEFLLAVSDPLNSFVMRSIDLFQSFPPSA